jgi:hypothetical protein
MTATTPRLLGRDVYAAVLAVSIHGFANEWTYRLVDREEMETARQIAQNLDEEVDSIVVFVERGQAATAQERAVVREALRHWGDTWAEELPGVEELF